MMIIKNFQIALINWFDQNKRSLPWRKDGNWYQRWISEVMLQQTQVEQVISYFNLFINKYPTIQALAEASIEDILKTWEGLGYYSRARNLHKAAQIICHAYGGILPPDRNKLRQLPGFGPYTAHALLSMVYNQPYGVVDGNILRIIARIYAVRDDIRLARTKQIIQHKMDRLLDKNNPGTFNEAMMELGATVCVPKSPACLVCPVNPFCKTTILNLQEKIPFKSPPPKKPKIVGLTYLLFNKGEFYIVQRPYKGLLAGLWEFPTFTLEQKTAPTQKYHQHHLRQLLGENIITKQQPLAPVKHSYTHFDSSLYPYLIYTDKRLVKIENYQQYQWVSYHQLDSYAMHIAMRKIIAKNKQYLKIES
jgi:A/G-specific adenine glycosylase